ncbi:hypothetical protein ABKV19_027650 [Rosa sericea]
MDRQAHDYAAYAQQQQRQRQPPPQQQLPPQQQFGYPPQAQQFHGPLAAAINDSKLHRITDDHERFIQTIRAIQGALIVASSIQIILGYSQVWGLFSRFFSPLGMAPVVGLVGLGFFERGFPELGKCVEIGIPMLLLVIGFSQVDMDGSGEIPPPPLIETQKEIPERTSRSKCTTQAHVHEERLRSDLQTRHMSRVKREEEDYREEAEVPTRKKKAVKKSSKDKRNFRNLFMAQDASHWLILNSNLLN